MKSRERLLLTAVFLAAFGTTYLVGINVAHARPADVRTYATAYCLHGGMRDGTTARPRSAASNVLPLGTKIRLVGRPFLRGMRRFVIRDTGSKLGDGHLDLWTSSCGDALRWGHRPVRYHRGWRR